MHLMQFLPLAAVFAGSASGACDPVGEAGAGEGEAFVPGEGGVGVGGGGVGAFPGEVQRGEFFDELPVTGPAFGYEAAVQGVVVDEPGDPQLEVFEQVATVFGGVRGPQDRQRWAAGLMQDRVGEERVMCGAGGIRVHSDLLHSLASRVSTGATGRGGSGVGIGVGPST